MGLLSLRARTVGLQLSLPEGSKEGETTGLDEASEIFRLAPNTRLVVAAKLVTVFTEDCDDEAGDEDGSASFFQKLVGRTAFAGCAGGTEDRWRFCCCC